VADARLAQLGIGSRLRQQREQTTLTIAEVAQRSGFSPGYISQIERDLANPSLGALKRITDAIGVPLGSLFVHGDENDHGAEDKPGEQVRVVRASQRKVLLYPGSQVHLQLLSPDLRRKLEAIWFSAPPGTGSGDEPYRHDGEEIGIVLRGRAECWVGDRAHTLGPGDAIYFPSHIPHGWRVAGDDQLEMIWVSTPPTF
jgi:transcriptional regulator with XRE-family HTH domain